MANVERYWARPAPEVLAALDSGENGLPADAASECLQRFGPNALAAGKAKPWLRLLLGRFTDPLVVVLVAAAAVSLLVQEWVDAWIVLGIVLLTAVLGFVQEYRASTAVEALRRRVTVAADVIRDGRRQSIPAEQVVPGDIVELSAGDLVPADARVLQARDCFVNQAILTGETLPVEKQAGECAADAALAARDNCVFMGTSLRSGSARVVVVDTGRASVFGGVADRLRLRPPETEFERGLHRFGTLLVRMMLGVVVAVLAINLLTRWTRRWRRAASARASMRPRRARSTRFLTSSSAVG